MSTTRSALALELFEQRTLARDAVEHAVGVRERVAAAALLEAAHEHVVGRVEEQDARAARPCARSSRSAASSSSMNVAGAHVDDEREARRPLAPPAELGDLRDERGRQVVDDEEAEVLEHVGRGSSGPRPTSR